jgi:hypothetical protein
MVNFYSSDHFSNSIGKIFEIVRSSFFGLLKISPHIALESSVRFLYKNPIYSGICVIGMFGPDTCETLYTGLYP